jgi:hypothetical protein
MLGHPPDGIARLQNSLGVETGRHALPTTPGATKWYRSTIPVDAPQIVFVSIGRPGVCEYFLTMWEYSGADQAEMPVDAPCVGATLITGNRGERPGPGEQRKSWN